MARERESQLSQTNFLGRANLINHGGGRQSQRTNAAAGYTLYTVYARPRVGIIVCIVKSFSLLRPSRYILPRSPFFMRLLSTALYTRPTEYFSINKNDRALYAARKTR